MINIRDIHVNIQLNVKLLNLANISSFLTSPTMNINVVDEITLMSFSFLMNLELKTIKILCFATELSQWSHKSCC